MALFFGMDPWDQMRRMERRLNKLSEQDKKDAPVVENTAWYPRTDLKETEAYYQVVVELPGVKKEDCSIDLSPEGLLTVRGKKENDKEEKGEHWHSVERCFGPFSRSFSIPKGVDPTKISAGFENGVLRLTIPKAPQQQPMKIEIK